MIIILIINNCTDNAADNYTDNSADNSTDNSTDNSINNFTDNSTVLFFKLNVEEHYLSDKKTEISAHNVWWHLQLHQFYC